MKRRDIDIEHFRQRLLARKAELENEAESTREDRRTVELDQQRIGRLSRMDALQSQAMANEIERHRQIELHHIVDALRRVKDGDYGYCTACDAKIPAKRLDLDPSVPLCVACAGKAKKA